MGVTGAAILLVFSQLASLVSFTAPPLSLPPMICVVRVPSRRAVVLITCEVVNEKDVCICTSRLSVDFQRRFVANVSHGYRKELHYRYVINFVESYLNI